jgi:hypothetical protein
MKEPERAETEYELSALAYKCDVNIVAENIDIIKENTEAVLDTSKEVGLKVNPEKTNNILMSRYQ